MTNNLTNWTTQTTWYKWFFTTFSNVAILVISIFLNSMTWVFYDYFKGASIWTILLVLVLINVGWILTFIMAIITWRNERRKLND